MDVLIFDLDNTLYHEAHSGIIAVVDRRIVDFMVGKLGMEREEADRLRREWWGKYGATLAGLIERFRVDPSEYLAYIHDIDVESFLAPDPRLDLMLEALPMRKFIFTNGPLSHAGRVLDRLGVRERFERLFTIETFNYRAKPHLSAYQFVLSEIGCDADRCFFIDDVPANLAPARELGMKTVLVHREGAHEADHHLNTIYELGERVLAAAPRG